MSATLEDRLEAAMERVAIMEHDGGVPLRDAIVAAARAHGVELGALMAHLDRKAGKAPARQP